jgi:CRP-like cAMP-binding protein
MLRIDERDFWQILVVHNALAVSLVRILAQRLRQMLASAG